MDPNEKIAENSPEFMKIIESVTLESIHCDMSFLQLHKHEDMIAKEYKNLLTDNNRIPLFYD
jgi:hypothetical protein